MAADTPNSLGEFLRQERERRGITIEQVASATKVSVRLLHSLEADHYVDLPARPFIRGFVTSYARFVGIDSKEVLTRYGDFIDSKAHDRPSREGGHSGYAFEKREGEQSRTILWVIMATFVVAGGGVIFVLKPHLHHHKETHADRLRASRGAKTSPSGTPDESASPAPGLAVANGTGSDASAAPTAGVSPQPSGAPEAAVAAQPATQPQKSPAPEVAAAAAVPAPAPVPIPEPAPAPSPAPVKESEAPPVAVAAATPEEKSPDKPAIKPLDPKIKRAPDPLNSGVDLRPSEIRYKIIFKALADVWLRYRVDEKPVMKFILRKDRILVLRSHEAIRFQVSNPKSVSFNLNGRGYKAIASEKNLAQRQKTATLFFPFELAEKIQEPFPGEHPLPTTAPPPPRTALPSPTPSP